MWLALGGRGLALILVDCLVACFGEQRRSACYDKGLDSAYPCGCASGWSEQASTRWRGEG